MNTADFRRRQFIICLLLVISFVLSIGAFLLAWYDAAQMKAHYHGLALPIMAVPPLIFGLLYGAARRGHTQLGAYSLIATYYSLATLSIIAWGLVLPIGLLLYALVLIMAGIVVNARLALALFIGISASIFIIVLLQSAGHIQPDVSWKTQTLGLDDAAVYLFILGIMTLIAWLFNREMERSLQRAHYSELALKQERDMLEIKIDERTQELKRAQLEKMTQLYKLAEIGKLASGLFHDIATPLTSVSLNLEQLATPERSELIVRAIEGTKRIEQFISGARKQIQDTSDPSEFSVKQEIDQTIAMLMYRATKAHVTITTHVSAKYHLYGSAVKFQQVILNIVLNAIDAFGPTQTDRAIRIQASLDTSHLHITIEDTGAGIDPVVLPRIFDPFFTTKTPDRGTGLGLAISHDIMTSAFRGSIDVTSTVGKGTTFVLHFPLTHK